MNKKWNVIRAFAMDKRVVLYVWIIAAVAASIHLLWLGPHLYADDFAGKGYYTEYNNYIIFKQSFYHLLAGRNLYLYYPAEQWDLYKYSPSFSLAMGALARLPDQAGLIIWNAGNALALYAAIRMLPIKQDKQTWLLWFCLAELLTSLQNSQSNGLMAGLMIAAYAHMERGKPQWATLWLVIAMFIKVYGAVGFCLFLFYPGKVRFLLWAALWTAVIAVLPLPLSGIDNLVWQYRNWATMIKEDEAVSYGLSVTGWLHSWFGLSTGKGIVSLAAAILLLLPLAKKQLYNDKRYRLLMLAFILIWVIIFNHKAESPTYIIAVAGAGIWYVSGPKKRWHTITMVVLFVFTCLSPTDLFPEWVRAHVLRAYTIKAVPCIFLWCMMLAELMKMKTDERTGALNVPAGL